MLNVFQKATILGKAGIEVPPRPAADPVADDALACPRTQEWAKTVEALYVSYVAARAAKSLRDAEESRQAEMLRRLSLSAWAA